MTFTGPDLTGAHAALERLMDDECVIRAEVAAGPEYDPGTRSYTLPEGATLYDGPCRLVRAEPSDQEQGDALAAVAAPELSLPISADPIPAGSVVEITSSRWDAQLVGLLFRVEGQAVRSIAVDRRLLLTLVTPAAQG